MWEAAPLSCFTPFQVLRGMHGSAWIPHGKAVIVLVPTGNPLSLRFGHPDVTFGRYRLSLLGYCAGAAAFSGCALRVSHGRSPQRSEEMAERPGDGCPCVGAEEICGAPPLLSEGRNEDEHCPSSNATYLNEERSVRITRYRRSVLFKR